MGTRVKAAEIRRPVVPTVPRTVRIPIVVQLIGGLTRTLGRAGVWLGRHLVTTGLLAAVVGLWWAASALGMPPLMLGLTVMLLAGVLLIGWRLKAPEGFRRVVIARLVGSWRAAVAYRPRWQAACESMLLARLIAQKRYLPRLVHVRSLGPVDTLTVRVLPGQTVEDWIDRDQAFATTFGAQTCRISTRAQGARGLVELRMLRRDPFGTPVEPFDPAPVPDLHGLPVAATEEGLTYRLPLLGNHVLLGGATGAGKSSAVQTLIDQLAPAIGAGVVQLWGFDMKGGIELAHARELFTRFEYADVESAAERLEELLEVMDARLDRMRGHTRLITPTPTEPLIVVLIDELAALTAYVNDPKIKTRLGTALKLLLTQGRAPGISIVGAVQDPRKETVPMRGLFSYRICLRMLEAADVELVLSSGARNRGAHCDQIPAGTPGVAYVEVDGTPEPVRVRFPHITDDRIASTATTWAPRSQLRPVDPTATPNTSESDEDAA